MKIVIPIDRKRGKPYYAMGGGNWSDSSTWLRITLRFFNDPSERYIVYGFRLVRKK